MGITYSFFVRVGFEIFDDTLRNHFKCGKTSKEDGIFHMEDRFDPKTGVKVEPVKVWDKKPKTKTETWWDIFGERFENWGYEYIIEVIEKNIGCNVDHFWQSDGDSSWCFYPHPPNNQEKIGDGSRWTIHNYSMDYQQVCKMQGELQQIKDKLEAIGINPGEAKVFIGECSG